MKINILNQITIPKLIYTIDTFKQMLSYLKSDHSKNQEFMFLGKVQKINNDYYIKKFYLPPQKTQAAFCETNDEKYPEWLINTIPIEERSLIRCHAHSHVNMSTHPSGTDDTMIKSLCENVSDYFIQLIINRKLENTINILDKEKNIIFEDISNYLEINTKDYNILINIKSINNLEIEALNIENKDNLKIINNELIISNTFKYNFIKNYSIINIEDITLNINNNNSNIIYEPDPIELLKINTKFKDLVEGQPYYIPQYSYYDGDYDFNYDEEYYHQYLNRNNKSQNNKRKKAKAK